MHRTFLPRGEVASTIPVWFVNAANWREHRDSLDAPARAFTDAAGFEPTPGRHFLIPSEEGGIARVLFAIEEVADSKKDFFRPGALTDSPMPLTIRAWQRLPLHWVVTGSRATASRRKRICAWSCRATSMARTS